MNACRVVLVRTQHAGNVGSVARVMRNMGASDLVLVSPDASPLDEQALALATVHGEPVLRSSRVVATLDEAVADCVLVAGTSARTAGLYRGQSAATLPEMGPVLVEAMTAGPVALVFGPERTGLENDEAMRCQWLVSVPTAEDYPVMNLAQAAGVCLYEVRRAWLARSPGTPPDVATFEEQERMFALLRAGLTRSRYLRGPGGNALWHAVRHLLTRARLSPVEVRLLLGLARQLEWLSERGGL
jgi:TrmH family RNA methyltransferase